MIKEAEVKELFGRFPKDSFLRKYVAFGSKCSTTPMAYHIVTGLACLSITVHEDGGTPYAGGVPTPFTYYGMIIGRSGDDQKSTALGIAERLIYDTNASFIGDKPASMEGAIESLSNQNKQILFYSEMGNFLSATKSGYGEAIKTLFTDLWDGTPQQRVKSGETIRVDKPRLNLCGACATKYLEKFTTEEDWHGGFLGRWFFIHAQRERIDPYPMRKIPQGRDWLIATLRQKINTKIGRCIAPTDDFLVTWCKWYEELQTRKLPSIITGLKSRIPAHCLRIAHLLQWDFGNTKGNYFLEDEPLKLAIEIIEMYIKSLISMTDSLCFDKSEKLRKRILDICKDTTTYPKLLKECNVSQKDLKDSLAWLITSEQIEETKFKNVVVFKTKE